MFDVDVRDDREAHDHDDASIAWGDDPSDALAEPIIGLARRGALILPPTTTVTKALELLGGSEGSIALVSSHDYLLGTVCEKQLVRRLLEDAVSAPATPVWRVMRVEPDTLLESDSVGYAIHKLCRLELAAMPVLHASRRLLGVLESRDLLHFMGARSRAQSCHFVGHG